MNLKAPFPWFGGKSCVADLVWSRFGAIDNYVEPFFGSGAVLLGSPRIHRTETVNDLDGYVSNFWRAVSHAPEKVADNADWPVNENDLHARHAWLVARREELVASLEGNPDYYDAKIAGWWVWGMASWIGSGFCSGQGPWHVVEDQLVNRKLPHLGDFGRGVNRKLPHLNSGQGVNRKREAILEWFKQLQARLRRVRVCCGDWSRVCGPSPTVRLGTTGVFLDPPYSEEAGRDMNLYTKDSGTVAHAVREWAVAHGGDPKMRIALCGYAGEHDMPSDWDCVAWKANGGYGSQGNENAARERIWFSPHCQQGEQLGMNFQ